MPDDKIPEEDVKQEGTEQEEILEEAAPAEENLSAEPGEEYVSEEEGAGDGKMRVHMRMYQSVKEQVDWLHRMYQHLVSHTSKSLMVSITVHVVVILILAIFAGRAVQKAMEKDVEVAYVTEPPGPPPPPPPPPTATRNPTETARNVTPSPASASATVKSAAVIPTVGPAMPVMVNTPTPVVAPGVKMGEIKINTDLNKKVDAARLENLKKIRDFQKDWKVSNISPTSRNKRTIKAVFTIFKAKYQDGDWNCNPSDLQNLMIQIRRWSKDRIEANIHPEVLDVGTDQLFTLKPPFVYLTGHKDFHFLEQEVKNLRDYLMLGGAVWADSALAGHRSRFDVAFRREMHRVLPDREWEILPDDHEIYDTFFMNIGLPSGMNYYREPIEIMKVNDEIAVVYTLNGYGHFWEARLKEKDDKIEFGRVKISKPGEKPIRWAWVFGPHAYGGEAYIRKVIYRNVSDESVVAAYKFGINTVVHLLTRYQKHFMYLPKDITPTGMQKPTEKPKETIEEEDDTRKEKEGKKITVIHKGMDGKVKTGTSTKEETGKDKDMVKDLDAKEQKDKEQKDKGGTKKK